MNQGGVRYVGAVPHDGGYQDEARPALAPPITIVSPVQRGFASGPLQQEFQPNLALPRDSYHFMMLVDSGHIDAVAPAMTREGGPAAPPTMRIAVAMLRRSREHLREPWAGFRLTATTVLFGDSPNGMEEEEAAEYLADSNVVAEDFVCAARVGMGAEFVPSTVRIDVVLTTKPANQSARRSTETIAVGHNAYVVPFILQMQSTLYRVHTQQMLRESMDDFVRRLQTWVDELPMKDSGRTLENLVGAFVSVTPTAALVYGHGSHIQRGLARSDPLIKDNACIARAIMMGLDPYLMARCDTSLLWIAQKARSGADRDANAATQRCLNLINNRAKEELVQSALEAELQSSMRQDEAHKQFVAAKSYAVSMGVILPDSNAREAHTVRAAYSRVEAALASAMSQLHPLADFSDVFFLSPQRIDAQTVQRIRAAVPHLAIQFWTDNVAGGISLCYPDTRAKESFLQEGGIVINLLFRDGHVSLITDVAALNARLFESNHRIPCPFCGVTFSHRDGTARISQDTAMVIHIRAGCPRSDDTEVTVPMSPRNLRQLSIRESRMRVQPPLSACCSVSSDGVWAALYVSVLTPSGRTVLPSPWEANDACGEWDDFYVRFSTNRSHYTDVQLDFLKSRVPPLTPFGKAWKAPLEDFLHRLCTYETLSYIGRIASSRLPRDAAEPTATDTCKFCRFPLTGLSRWVSLSRAAKDLSVTPLQFAEDADDDEWDLRCEESHAGTRAVLGDPATCATSRVHEDCYFYAISREKGTWFELTVDVDSEDALVVLLQEACTKRFSRVATPKIFRGRSGLRAFELAVHATADKPAARIVFRSPSAFFDTIPFIGVADPDRAWESMVEQRASSLVSWADRTFAAIGLWPLSFPTAITFAKAQLLDSVPFEMGIPTSLVSTDAIAYYKRMTFGGRMVTGSATLTTVDPSDTKHAILSFDVRAMYPTVLREDVIPMQEHTDTVLHDWSADLEGGLSWVKGYDTHDKRFPVSAVEVTGFWPAELHEQLRHFPPVYSRVTVTPDMLTPFQRTRMGIKDMSPPRSRVVAHLLPVESLPVFLRELQLWMRLGFVVTKLGVARGCKGDVWGREFALRAEALRRSAEESGDVAMSESIKRFCNTSIGALNRNTASNLNLVTIVADEVDFTSGSLVSGVRSSPAETSSASSSKRSRDYKVRRSDDPAYAGWTYECGEYVFVVYKARETSYTQQLMAVLAVHAYARVRQAEMWYFGIVRHFPRSTCLYGNNDSIYATFSLTPELIAEGFTDIRVAVACKLIDWVDSSDACEGLWTKTNEDQYTMLQCVNGTRGRRWGLWKEQTNWKGIAAIVVNGPNRYGYRVIEGTDVLKRLPACWTGTSFEQYAANWLGGHTEEERHVLLEAADSVPDGRVVKVPLNGTCTWGNSACIVSVKGEQWPFGISHSVPGVRESFES